MNQYLSKMDQLIEKLSFNGTIPCALINLLLHEIGCDQVQLQDLSTNQAKNIIHEYCSNYQVFFNVAAYQSVGDTLNVPKLQQLGLTSREISILTQQYGAEISLQAFLQLTQQ